MKRQFCLLMCVLVVGVGCGSDEEGWQFLDREVVNIEDTTANVESNGQAGEGEEPVRDVPGIEDFERPESAEPSVAPVACDSELSVYSVPSVIEGRMRSGRGEVDEVPCSTSAGLERRYQIAIEEPTDVRIWADYHTTEFSPVLLLQSGCGDETTDVFCSSPLSSHPGDANANIQARLEPGVYTLTIDERNNLGFGEGGGFKIFVERAEIASNGTCEQAEPLAPGDLPEISNPLGGGTGALTGCFPGNNLTHFWKVRMPARSSARVRAEYLNDEISQGPWIRVREACEEFCEGPYGSGWVSIANTADVAADYVVSVADSREEAFRVWVEGFIPLARNSMCESATRLERDDWVRGNPIEGSEHAPLCGGDPVRQLYYEVEVPPNHRLLTHVDGVGMVAYESCEVRECLYNPVNTSGATQSYILAAGSRSEDPFQFNPSVVELAENSSCADATPLEIGGREWGYMGAGGDSRGDCELVFAEGFTHWYSATIPPNTAYELRVERVEGANLNVEVIEGGCAGTCADQWDSYFHGPTDPIVPLENDGTEPRQVMIAVTPDGQSSGLRNGYFFLQMVER